MKRTRILNLTNDCYLNVEMKFVVEGRLEVERYQPRTHTPMRIHTRGNLPTVKCKWEAVPVHTKYVDIYDRFACTAFVIAFFLSWDGQNRSRKREPKGIKVKSSA